MRKLSLVSVIVVFAVWLAMPNLAQADPIIDVTPLSYDFGDVEVGSFSTTIITMSNIGGHNLYICDYLTTPTTDFTITAGPGQGISIPPGESEDIEVTFAPSALGGASVTLHIESDDIMNSSVEVSLSGTGVSAEKPPEEQIADILDFFDAAVTAGTIEGDGSGNSADGRMGALRNQIEAAGDLLADGNYEDGCQQLLDAYNRCDGQPKPPDFITGTDAAELAVLIENLRLEVCTE